MANTPSEARPNSRKRRCSVVFSLGLCLLAGAVVTVLVSWAAALWVREPVMHRKHSTANAQWPIRVPADWPPEPFDYRGLRTSLVWRAEEFGYDLPKQHYGVTVRSTGWPLPALWGATAGVSAAGGGRMVRQTGFLYVPKWIPQFRPPTPPQFPMWIPAPIGFTVDTLFYTTLMASLAVGLRWIRTASRRRGGRCWACGYDRRGLPSAASPCPECGAVGA